MGSRTFCAAARSSAVTSTLPSLSFASLASCCSDYIVCTHDTMVRANGDGCKIVHREKS